MYAARELYKREWRYHKELKLWFSRAANANAAAAAGGAAGAAGAAATALGPDGKPKDPAAPSAGSAAPKLDASGKPVPGSSSGDAASAAGGVAGADANTYLFFDINAWERRIFRDTHMLQPNKFMTEEDLRDA